MPESSLEEVLTFREKKARIQQEMISEYPKSVVIGIGMNIPGPVKCTPLIQLAFKEGCKSLEKILDKLQVLIEEVCLLEEIAGYAAIYRVYGQTGGVLKQAAVELEEQHELGRIFDIDIIESERKELTRTMLGKKMRKCLICDGMAKECGRNRTHSVQQLQEKVSQIITDWKEKQVE